MSTVMNIRVSKMRGISGLAAEPVSFSRRTLFHGVSKKVIIFSNLYLSRGNPSFGQSGRCVGECVGDVWVNVSVMQKQRLSNK